ncbi:MAG: tetratricopeptide repeat protein, partial [Janthinobacterium lividum]
MIALLVAVAAGLFPVALSATPAASGPSASGTDTAMETAAASFADLIARARGQMQRDPALAVRLSRAAQTLAENRAPSPSRDVDVATSKWLQGEALIRLNQLAPAAPLIREALASIGRLAPNTKLHGDALLSQAAIDTANGSPDKALADFQRAYQIFKEAREPRSQAIALQSMASIYQDAGDYRKVFNYYSQAAEAFPNDLPLSLSASNNLANSLVKQGKYKDAETEYNRALRFATALGSPLLQARILNNIARAQIGENDLGAAQASLARGLLLARGGEAAGWRPVLLGTAASLALKQDRAAEAARLVSEAFAKVDLATTTQIFRDM